MSPVAEAALQQLRAAPIVERGRPTLHFVDLIEQPAGDDRIRFEVHFTFGRALWAWPIHLFTEDFPPAASELRLGEYVAAEIRWRLDEWRDIPESQDGARLLRAS